MHLYLVQHGLAMSEAEDPERPLSETGAREVERIGQWARLTGAVDAVAIHHSGKRRAEQTARMLADHVASVRTVSEVPGLAPRDDVEPVAAALAQRDEPLVIVGHLPHLARLAGRLLTGDADRAPVRFTNAGIVCLARDEGAWAITWAVTPRQLAA